MKNLKLRKLVAVALAVMTIATVSPIGASAAWKQDSNGWWNTEGSSWSTGWRNINGSWYDFGSNGYMKTGWVNDGGKWYFTAPSGEMKTGWVSDGGKWYFTAPSGEMKTGWVSDGGKWYFTASSGAMQTGVVEVAGKAYYLAPSGAMATGAVTIAGETYTFAASGEAIGDKIPTPTVAFASTGTAVTPTTTGTTTGTTTTDTTTTSSSGGGSSSSHHSSDGNTSGGNTSNVATTIDVTGIVSDALVDKVNNNAILGKHIYATAGTAGTPIGIKLLNSNLNSLESIFTTAQSEDETLIKTRLDNALDIMSSHSAMVQVDGVSLETYLAQAETNANYVASGGNISYFKGGKFDTIAIAKRIKDGTLHYVDFQDHLNEIITAMCNKKAPQVSISYNNTLVPVTEIVKDGTPIYVRGDKNISVSVLVNLEKGITGTYTVYCEYKGLNGLFTVNVSK